MKPLILIATLALIAAVIWVVDKLCDMDENDFDDDDWPHGKWS